MNKNLENYFKSCSDATQDKIISVAKGYTLDFDDPILNELAEKVYPLELQQNPSQDPVMLVLDLLDRDIGDMVLNRPLPF